MYDEITQVEDVFFCRIWEDYQIYDLEGNPQRSSRTRREWNDDQLASIITTNNFNVLVDSREGLDNVPLVEDNDVFKKYENGKFGIITKTGEEIIPCIYDDVYRWRDCDVISARIGNSHYYFDLKGLRILKSYKVEPRRPFDEPYYLGEQQRDTALVIKRYVESCFDDQCCICYGRPFRLDRIPKGEIEGDFRNHSERIEFDNDAFEIFNGPDAYIYSEYIVEGPSLDSCIEDLKSMRCYKSSWYHIDKVLTNDCTLLSDIELAKLKDAACCKTWISDNGCIDYRMAYGIDNTMPDGIVKVKHIEFFAERRDWWNDPKPRKASDYAKGSK